MLRRLALIVGWVILSASGRTMAFGQHARMGSDRSARAPAQLLDGIGAVHHPVTTRHARAQQFFDQGLALVYGFNHEEAARSFAEAGRLDPGLAMAHWGLALALGPNINQELDDASEASAFDAIQKARSLSAQVTPAERAYIQALSLRYAIGRNAGRVSRARAYSDAMERLSRRYPADLDAATLYAESLMVLRPWRLWRQDGTPAPGTPAILRTLESALRRDCNHLGANHYYIHAIEASPHPEWGLAAARRLEWLAPKSGHLVHMPSHVFMRQGRYIAAVEANVRAARVDKEYIDSHQVEGTYPLMYFTHNLHFLAIAAGACGQYRESMSAAKDLEDYIRPHIRDMPEADSAMASSLLTNIRFRRWDLISEDRAEPDAAVLPITRCLWHFGRGLAAARNGNLAEAARELRNFIDQKLRTPPESRYGTTFNTAGVVLEIPQHLLGAEVCAAQRDAAGAVRHFRRAAMVEDSLVYDEPPSWWLPVREMHGAFHLRRREYREARAVFQEDLARNPKNPRSLFGLKESLRGLGHPRRARKVERNFREAWSRADVVLDLKSF